MVEQRQKGGKPSCGNDRFDAARPAHRYTRAPVHQGRMPMYRRAAVAMVCLVSSLLSSAAFAQQANRTVLKQADLSGTNMEIIISTLEIPPGTTIEKHTHPGEEAVYVLEGATLQMPDGTQVTRPAGQAGVNVRDVPHAGYKVVGDKPLKLLTVHIVDKGKPMTVPAK
jgi:quercetin dioxygenase-like cupin family protein